MSEKEKNETSAMTEKPHANGRSEAVQTLSFHRMHVFIKICGYAMYIPDIFLVYTCNISSVARLLACWSPKREGMYQT